MLSIRAFGRRVNAIWEMILNLLMFPTITLVQMHIVATIQDNSIYQVKSTHSVKLHVQQSSAANVYTLDLAFVYFHTLCEQQSLWSDCLRLVQNK